MVNYRTCSGIVSLESMSIKFLNHYKPFYQSGAMQFHVSTKQRACQLPEEESSILNLTCAWDRARGKIIFLPDNQFKATCPCGVT